MTTKPMNIESLMEKEESLLTYTGEDRIVTIGDIRIMLDMEKQKPLISSGIKSLDDLIGGGFEQGEYISISGISGMGKTTLARTLSNNFAKNGVQSLWFSYEEIYRDFTRRFPDGLTVYMPAKLLDRKMDWIEERIWEAKLKYEVKAVFIDHLHFLTDGLAMRNPSLEIGAICRKITQIAKERNVVIFLIAHLTKVKFEEEPDMDDIRDSSFITQEAHKVFMVWRRRQNGEYTEESVLKVCKDRRSGTIGKKVPLFFNGKIYQEITKNYD